MEEKMKKNRLLAVLLALALALTACGAGGSKTQDQTEGQDLAQTEAQVDESTYKIGITQIMEHTSLDQTRQGFEDGLKELGLNVEIDYKNAHGDLSNSNTIAAQLVGSQVDMIFAISTPSAQSAQNATTEVPILFSAVTDAVEAGLVASNEAPEANITGTSDAAPIKEQLAILLEIDPDIKNVGILYTTSEKNSEVQVDQAKAIGAELGLTIVEKGITTISDLPQAIDALFPVIDALYLITDNTVADSVALVSEKLIEYSLPSSTAFESGVEDGILISEGLSYYELGKQAANQAKALLVDGKAISEIPVETAQNIRRTANKKTAEALGLDVSQAPFVQAEIIE